MKLVKILLTASLLTLALGKATAQINLASPQQSLQASNPDDGDGNGENF